MKKTLLIISCFFAAFLLGSCKSTPKNSEYKYDENETSPYDEELEEENSDDIYEFSEKVEKPVSTDDFIADLGPVQIANIMMLSKSKSSIKPKEITKVYLIPRTNNVELQFRDTVNAVVLILNKAERQRIIDACNLFLQEYDEKKLEHKKVNSKNAYFKSKCSLWFGLTNASNGCNENDYFVTYEFIDRRPYLLIQTIPSRCTSEDKNAFTPRIQLYMSPSQIRDFIQQMDQENLESYLTETIEKAYTY